MQTLSRSGEENTYEYETDTLGNEGQGSSKISLNILTLRNNNNFLNLDRIA